MEATRHDAIVADSESGVIRGNLGDSSDDILLRGSAVEADTRRRTSSWG